MSLEDGHNFHKVGEWPLRRLDFTVGAQLWIKIKFNIFYACPISMSKLYVLVWFLLLDKSLRTHSHNTHSTSFSSALQSLTFLTTWDTRKWTMLKYSNMETKDPLLISKWRVSIVKLLDILVCIESELGMETLCSENKKTKNSAINTWQSENSFIKN